MQTSKQQLATRIGIVTTVADAAEHIEFFIQYHLSIGIHHIFVFIDDGCEDTYKIALKYKEVTAVFVDENLAEYWKTLPVYRNLEKRKLRNKEVMIRQEYNVHVGFVLAKEKGINWLLHIDLDELFYPNETCLDAHYKELEKADIGGCIYLNYEAIPVADEGECIYTTTPFFKKNFFKKGHWFFNEEQAKFIENTEWLSKFFFNYYQNGKAAANLSHDLIVEDVHAMWSNGKRLEFLSHTDPIILHFPSITLAEFRKKYKRLGKFDDLWKGYPRVGKFIDPLHLDARNAYINGTSLAFDELYRTRIQASPQKIKSLIDLDLAVEINEIRQFDRNFCKTKFVDSYLSVSDTPIKLYEKPNLCRFKTVSINKLASSSDDSLRCIEFAALGEARKWIRRHPSLCDDTSCSIVTLDRFVIAYNNVPICDAGSAESISILANILNREIVDDNSIAIDIREPICAQVPTGRTSFDFLMEKILTVKRIIKRVDEQKRDRLFILIKDDQEYLFGLESHNFIPTEITVAIENFNRTNLLAPLVLFLSRRYPRRSNRNCAIQLPQNMLVSKSRQVCLEALLYSLGGTILYSGNEKPSNMSKQLARIRNKFRMIKDVYASALENIDEILVIKKEDSDHKFLGIINFGKKCKSISKEQLVELFVVPKWTNLLTEEPCVFRQTEFIMPAEQFIWLIHKVHT